VEVQNEVYRREWKICDAPRISVATTTDQTLDGHESRFDRTSELDIRREVAQGIRD